jgi:hypothetical protein
MTTRLDVDYLLVGAGAMSMAFADTLLAETGATMAIVDRCHQPGGHWNFAYPFVRLHQPSAFYGVSSEPLGHDTLDLSGLNLGLFELASSGEICAYYGRLMQQRLLPSGRVSYFPMSEYEGDGKFCSIISGETYKVRARKRVDASYMRVNVPSMRTPPYAIAEGVQCLTPNELAYVRKRPQHYTVVGAGKTGIDVCLFLLRNHASPEDITWIMPRDSWLLDRGRIQPGEQFADIAAQASRDRARSVLEATSVDDLFDNLEKSNELLRIDRAIRPKMYRCATVSRPELSELRRLTTIIRMGRVLRIAADHVELETGAIEAVPGTLYIDCSADGLEKHPPLPVFNGDLITLQSVRVCQQVFSAAFIAHLEATYSDDETKNTFSQPVPHPDTDIDWLRSMLLNLQNQLRWAADPALQKWLKGARLDWFGRLVPKLPDNPIEREQAKRERGRALRAQVAKLQTLLGECEGADA